MIKDSKFTLLDCSLRDGGYYNKWNFSSELLLTYLDSCKNAGIKIVELGFKSFPKDGFWGPFYYTTDDYLEQFDLADSFDILRILKSLGYRVALNLMQSQGKHHENYLKAINEIRELGIVSTPRPASSTSRVPCLAAPSTRRGAT